MHTATAEDVVGRTLSNDEAFEELTRVGRNIVIDYRNTRSLTNKDLFKKTGVKVKYVEAFLERSEPISGKDWQRLLCFCSLPEDWIQRARIKRVEAGTEVCFVAASGREPSRRTSSKVQHVLGIFDWYIRRITDRFLELSEEK